MEDINDHPYGERCITALFKAFDPECEKVGFITLPWYESDEIAIWYFTADMGGDEHESGEIFASGLVSVQKSRPVAAIWTIYPMQSFALIKVFD